MVQTAEQTDEMRWDKADAPRIGRGRLVVASIVFVAWIGFLAFFAAQRWFGTLQ